MRSESSGGRIQILNGFRRLRSSSYSSTNMPELLHRSTDRPASRDTRELEAEAVAFVVGDAVGLDVGQARQRLHSFVPSDRDALAQSLTGSARVAILGALRAVDPACRSN